jgi:hypothetical protein
MCVKSATLVMRGSGTAGLRATVSGAFSGGAGATTTFAESSPARSVGSSAPRAFAVATGAAMGASSRRGTGSSFDVRGDDAQLAAMTATSTQGVMGRLERDECDMAETGPELFMVSPSGL